MRKSKSTEVPTNMRHGTDDTTEDQAIAWATKLHPQVKWRVARREQSGPVELYVLEHEQVLVG